MHIAILSFDGFNELDCFVPLGLLNRLKPMGWSAELCGPGGMVTSMNGVNVQVQRPLEWANEADAVWFGAGLYTRAIAENSALLDRLQLDPTRQMFAAHGAGALLLARLGLLGEVPACTDGSARPWLVEAGVRVLNEPFHARGPVATAGGGLASQYLSAWLIWQKAGEETAREALGHAAPVGQKSDYVDSLLGIVRPFMAPATPPSPP
ncbi:DJ-1/PfpI family protein [Roseateles sp. YR242]|uniref:DJ-1/PfpI family protein n=1 Tax=Roseateles sp. YR242 TaxID=1855305 RepID=UPI0008CBB06C|nr:DJ-1/PfpI family protein [Roseateles sp. YR242]SEK84655.1 DJ-1/PfpI family protein [Roseateles sp. YR242]